MRAYRFDETSPRPSAPAPLSAHIALGASQEDVLRASLRDVHARAERLPATAWALAANAHQLRALEGTGLIRVWIG